MTVHEDPYLVAVYIILAIFYRMMAEHHLNKALNRHPSAFMMSASRNTSNKTKLSANILEIV